MTPPKDTIITVEREDIKVIITVPWDANTDQMLDEWERLCAIMAYHHKAVQRAIVERAEEIKLNDE